MKLQIFFIFIVTTIFEISQKNYVCGSKIIEKNQNRPKWSRRVIRTIKKDPTIYQIVLLTNYENFEHIKVIKDLQENLPTLHFNDSFIKRETQHLGRRNSLRNPRDTTLFLIVESSAKNDTQWIEEMMEFIKKLSTIRTRPKCLILRFFVSDATTDYGKFLEKMWKNLFLDVTILDVIKERATIHQLNPFVSYKSQSFTKKTPLLPNKLRNLNGYPIKVAIFNRLPFVQLKRNLTYHPVNASGPDVEVGKIFAKILNYTQVLVPSEKETFGRFSCNSNKLTEFISATQQNKIQFISVSTTSTKLMCKKEIFENAIFALDQYVAVIPTLKSINSSITIGNTFYNSILLTVLITITGCIIMRCMNFDRTIWNWPMFIQILFGISVDKQPKKLKERIIYLCILIVNFYYSCNILASLTDFNYLFEREKEINTLTDLVKSGLQLCSEPNIITMMPIILPQSNVKAWVKKSRILAFDKCIEFLLDYKNVTCIAKLPLAKWHIDFYREQNLVKVVPECLATVGRGFFLEPGSPYVEKFERIHKSLMEFALLEKWQMKKFPNITKQYELTERSEQELDESEEEWKIRSLLIGVLMAGYFASFLLFVAELAFGKWKRRSRPL